ncbi:hypothetical protein GCM10012278_84330 [Nonomuraea glycinis]|uniref:Uncharacterized protein n=1 Tax=Nonomuraea glycinis TaxID=2047744 RepID=A0A918EAZ4_9ACTN|nr:hypothetical protein GCM10012278_84330 [Nonomuraea glycinis]
MADTSAWVDSTADGVLAEAGTAPMAVTASAAVAAPMATRPIVRRHEILSTWLRVLIRTTAFSFDFRPTVCPTCQTLRA